MGRLKEDSNGLKFLGHKLRQIRKLKRLTMEELEALTGVRQSKISRYETGKEFPNTKTATKFAEALNVDLCYFYLENVVLRSGQTSTSEPIPPNEKTPYIVLGERAEKMGFPLSMLEAIINSWEKNEKKKQEKD
jgi:transcriptional regulator with XRE-family HTH domain